MKFVLCTLAVLCLVAFKTTKASCSIGQESDPQGRAKASDPDNTVDACTDAIRGHIKMEFEAALQYMVMGAHFAQDTVNLGGFSKMFFEHASEERAHGIKFIEYLRMRGDDSTDLGIENLVPILKGKNVWQDGEEALRDALSMEKAVSKNINALIGVCENGDYFSADWLTGVWLEEQLGGQRHLAGLINSLSTFRRSHENLADWMFSNQLLKED